VREWRGAVTKACILAASLGGSGCYKYVPTELAAVPIGDGVRVYLSRDGMDRFRKVGGDVLPNAGTSPVLAGTLVRLEGGEFSLEVPVATRQVGFLSSQLDQRVTLPVADVVQVESRKVSGLRTAALTVAGTALIGYAIVEVVHGARDPVPGNGGDPDNLRIPLFKVRAP
jgi:hypothetical protein